jgi:hypothetical protein
MHRRENVQRSRIGGKLFQNNPKQATIGLSTEQIFGRYGISFRLWPDWLQGMVKPPCNVEEKRKLA